MQTEIPTISPGQLHYKQLYGHRPALLDVRRANFKGSDLVNYLK